jgi:EmrB/QacA subfamily drug resistance transporter
MIGFGLSSLLAGLASNIEILIVFRLIQGISCAILYTASGAIVSNAFPAEERGKAIGTLFGINGIGLAIGPVLGGILVSALDWRWIFFINVPLILISLLICFISVRESFNEDSNSGIDWFGLFTLIIGLSCLVLCITEGTQWEWLSLKTFSIFSISVLMLFSFYFIEQRVTSPIIQFHLFINRQFIVSIVATAALAFFYCVAFFLIPLYLNLVRGEQSYVIGLMLLPITASVAIFSPVVGRIVDRIGPQKPMMAGLCFFILSALLQLTFSVDTSIIFIILAFLLIGIGWSCILGPSTVAALSSVPENSGAVAMGSSWTFHNIGGAIGLALGIVIFNTAAKITLVDYLNDNHIRVGDWFNHINANPEKSISILEEYLQRGHDFAVQLYQQSFLTGYHACMSLLAISSFMALLVVFFGATSSRQIKV